MNSTGFPGWRDWLFSLKAYIASMMALFIALACGMDRPYWSMAAVYIVVNPLSGATRSKALYRSLGSMLGGAGAVLILPTLANAPVLCSLVVALWTGGFLFISLLDRTPRSYVFMLAGYTLPLIALPVVSDPTQVFSVAVARAQEITLGIICAAIVTSVFFPTQVGPVLGASAQKWLKDASAWIHDMLTPSAGTVPDRERQRLAADIRAMDMLISQLSYDSAVKAQVRRAREMRGRMAVLLPTLSSLSDRLAGVREAGAMPPGLAELTGRIVQWMTKSHSDDDAAEAADRLRAELQALEPRGEASREWNGLLLSSALERMREVVDIWQDCRALQHDIAKGDRTVDRFRPAYGQRRLLRPVHYYDYGMLMFSAISVIGATFVSSLIWIFTGWAEGAGCVIMTAVGCSFFASLDNPVPQIKSFVIWMTVAIGATGVYLFGILPAVHDFVPLAAVFALPFLALGTLIPRPQFMIIAMLLIVNVASLVAIGATFSADFSSFINGNIASVAGGLFGLVWVLITRPFGVAYAARRLAVAGWAELAETARGGRNADPERFASRIFDRIGQLVPRLAQGIDADIAATDTMLELRIAINVLDLQRLRPSLPVEIRWHVGIVLEQIAALYSSRVEAGKPLPPTETLRDAIDDALSDLTAIEPDAAGRAALQSLVGVRRAFFPKAPPPKHLGTEPATAPQAIAAE